MKNIRKHIVWIGIVLYMVTTLSFVSKEFDQVLCEKVNVVVKDSSRLGFVQPEDVVSLFKTMDLKIWGYNAFDVKTYQVERTIFNNMPLVKSASVWADVNGELNVEIWQREPIVRIVTKTNQSYYLDNEANVLPVSPDFTARVLVASGDIYTKYNENRVIPLDSVIGKNSKNDFMLDELYIMAQQISKDNVLKRQIEQIYINKNEFEMYPKVGTHSILFGTVDNLEDKFFKLKVIYYKGFSNLGWNKYRQINLKYKNQVVCTKR